MIPRIADVLIALPDAFFLIEIKVPEAAAPLRRVIEAAGAADRCIVESFHDGASAAFAGSAIAWGASQRDVVRLLPRAVLHLAAPRLPFRFMAVPLRHGVFPVPVSGLIAATRTVGAPVHVWTIDEPVVAERLWRLGVTGIISNDPGPMLAVRGRAA